MAGKRNIEITQCEDYSHVITLNQRVAGVVTPINITGRTYSASLKKVKTQAVPDAVFTVVLTDPTDGEFTLYLGDTITCNLDVACYHWDVWQSVSGTNTPILKGEAKVVKGVTE